jgi:hypothetical protein
MVCIESKINFVMSIPAYAHFNRISPLGVTRCLLHLLSGFSTAAGKFVSIVRRARMVSIGDNEI